jgi:hypothetical protein
MNIPGKRFFAFIVTLLIWAIGVLSFYKEALSEPRTFEEIVVSFEIPRLIKKDLFAQYSGNTIYLPVIEIFNLLELSIDADLKDRLISGYVINKDRRFSIDLNNFSVRSGGQKWPIIASDFYLGSTDLYLKIDLFDRLFGLKMDFNFSALRVYLPLNKDFPSYQRLQRKQEHEKLLSRTASLRDVMEMPRHRELLSAGVIDWAFSTSPVGGGGHYFDMNAGSMFLGGDLNIAAGGNTVTGFEPDQTTYRWHYFVGNNRYLSQAELGFINTSGPLSRGLKGAMITNRPQSERKYFQTINLAGYLGQNWEVELYIDQKLIDFQTTDQSGEYDFNLDIYYGASLITLKMYGPNGEIKSEERYIRIPYNLIPKKNYEYFLAGGQSSIPAQKAQYGQGSFLYGLSENLTLGVSADLPANPKSEEKLTYATEITYQASGNLTLNCSFSPGNADRYGVNYSRLSAVNINGCYTKYYENQFRNKFSQKNSAQLSISTPFKFGGRYLGLRYNAIWDKYPSVNYINMSYGFNASISRLQLGYTGKYKWSIYVNRTLKELTSQLLISAMFIPWVQPQFRVTYDHMENRPNKYSIILNRRLFKTGQVALTYERNQDNKSNMFMFSLNFFTNFANFSTRAISSGKTNSVSQVQRGSVRYDNDAGAIRFDRRTGVGFGSAVIRPFQDSNFNGVRDKNEDYLPGIKAKITGGREKPIGRTRIFYYDGLRPYENYLVQIDQNSIDNPTLRPAYENYKIVCNPNIITPIEVPLVPVSELSGMVWRQTAQGKNGIGGIRIMLLNQKTESLVEVVSFSNGEYYYEGIIPGSYRAYIDPEQLTRYGYISDPDAIDFEVKPEDAGTCREKVDFTLSPKE